MSFACIACGKPHRTGSEFCEDCANFLDRFEGLVDEHEDPLAALRVYCQDEFDWVVFEDEDQFETHCVERMRDLAHEGVRL